MNNYGHWDISQVGEFDPNEWFGFIYLVTNLHTNKKYVGKKSFFHNWKVKSKTSTRRKTVRKETNWKTYTTSSKYVNSDIENNEPFKFEILTLHTTKGALSYAEMETQILLNVLKAKDDNGNPIFYNRCIGNVKFIPPDEFSNQSKLKMSTAQKGISWEEKFGKEKATELKTKLSTHNKKEGKRPPPNKELALQEFECKCCKKIFKRKHQQDFCSLKCNNNSKIGKPAWNKGIPSGIKTKGSTGLQWFTNGNVNKMLDPTQTIPDGFTKGRTL